VGEITECTQHFSKKELEIYLAHIYVIDVMEKGERMWTGFI
jgi:hypothetical protein